MDTDDPEATVDGRAAWALLLPERSTVLTAPRGRRERSRVTAQIAALPAGSPVVLLEDRAGARRRTRRLAERSGVTIRREYVAVPSLRSAVVVIEDEPQATRWVTRSLVTVPPGVTWLHAPADLLVRLLRGVAPWWVLGALVPGRVTVGSRT